MPFSPSKHTSRVGLALAFSLGLAATALAQDEGRRVYEEQLRVKLDQQVPEAREVAVDAGGWLSVALFKYDDVALRKFRTLRQYELRAWAHANIQGVHQFYVRALGAYDDWNSGSQPEGDDENDCRDVEIERAWYQFDLGQLLRNQTGKQPPVGLRIKVGRAFAEIGTALVLSMPLDMIQFDLSVGNLEVMALLGKTIAEHPNSIDESDAVYDHQRRCFWGIQAAYTGFSHHRPFAYFLSQDDHTKPDPWDVEQGYDYSSRYIGVGCQGTLLTPNLHYMVEVVGELGQTYSEGVAQGQGRDRICAMAATARLEYYFQARTQPRVEVEYMYGSGDSDRRLSTNSTVGGNLAGTKDYAFNAFGFRDTGIAFAPRISNIHIYKVGASFFPFEDIELLRRMEVGTKAFFYHKADQSGPVSDTTATNPARWLGWEWDVYCDWRLTSDLTWTVRYGMFQPGEAFEDEGCRHFLYTAITYSF
jgi:hypothetical protein